MWVWQPPGPQLLGPRLTSEHGLVRCQALCSRSPPVCPPRPARTSRSSSPARPLSAAELLGTSLPRPLGLLLFLPLLSLFHPLSPLFLPHFSGPCCTRAEAQDLAEAKARNGLFLGPFPPQSRPPVPPGKNSGPSGNRLHDMTTAHKGGSLARPSKNNTMARELSKCLCAQDTATLGSWGARRRWPCPWGSVGSLSLPPS